MTPNFLSWANSDLNRRCVTVNNWFANVMYFRVLKSGTLKNLTYVRMSLGLMAKFIITCQSWLCLRSLMTTTHKGSC